MKRMKLTHPLRCVLAMTVMLAVCAICLPAHGSPYTYITKPDVPLPEHAKFRIGSIAYHDGFLRRTSSVMGPKGKFMLIEQPSGGVGRKWEQWNIETGKNKVISNQLSDYGTPEELKGMFLPMTKFPKDIDRAVQVETLSYLACSGDGRYLYARCNHMFEHCSFIKLDLEKGKVAEVYGQGIGTIPKVAFGADMKRAVTSAQTRGETSVWDLEKGIKLWSAKHISVSVAISPDGRHLLCGGETSFDAIALLDMKTGRKLWETPPEEKVYSLDGIAFHPNNKQVLLACEDLSLWDVQTGKKLKSFQVEAGRSCSVAFSPDGTQFLSGHESGMICLWNTATGKLERVFKGHERHVHDLSYSKDGSGFVSVASDGTALVWKLPDPGEKDDPDARVLDPSLAPKASEVGSVLSPLSKS